MTVRGIPAPQLYQPSAYWEDRAQRFAGEGAGLAAVCAYGMPEFYNQAIQLEQRLALRPWLQVKPGTRVLDVGCGVGRWSRMLAAKGATVTGVDLSPTMIAQAQQRAAAEGVADRCQFRVQDLSRLEVDGQFDVVLGVTVLQHILDPELLRDAVRRMTEPPRARWPNGPARSRADEHHRSVAIPRSSGRVSETCTWTCFANVIWSCGH